MACMHIQYTGGTNPFGSDYNCYHCDLCNKTWNWGDPEVEQKCNNGEEYRNCPIWQKYAW